MNKLTASSLQLAGIRPQAAVAASATVDGPSFDRQAQQLYSEAVLLVQVGAVTGSPTGTVMTFKIQESDNNSDWTDITDLQKVSAATLVLGAANAVGRLNLSIRSTKRYVRATGTNALTGGSSPTAFWSAQWLLLGGERL